MLNKIFTFEKKMLLSLLLGVSLAMCLNLIIASIDLDRFFPGYSVEVRPWLFRFPLYTGLLLYGVVTPLIEELIFRYLFFNKLCIYVTTYAAGIASSIIFGIYHGNAVQFIYAFIFGLILSFVFWRFDSLTPCVLLHGAANAYVYLLYFIRLPEFMNHIAYKVIVILLSGLVSFFILMYFLNTAPVKNVLPEKPFFPTRNG